MISSLSLCNILLQESYTAWEGEVSCIIPGEDGGIVGRAVGQVMRNGQVEHVTLGSMDTPDED